MESKVLIYKEQEKALIKYARNYFNNCESLQTGFAIDLITVHFKKGKMLIYDFDPNGKLFETSDDMPLNGLEMVSIMKKRCGSLKIHKRINPTTNDTNK